MFCRLYLQSLAHFALYNPIYSNSIQFNPMKQMDQSNRLTRTASLCPRSFRRSKPLRPSTTLTQSSPNPMVLDWVGIGLDLDFVFVSSFTDIRQNAPPPSHFLSFCSISCSSTHFRPFVFARPANSIHSNPIHSNPNPIQFNSIQCNQMQESWLREEIWEWSARWRRCLDCRR